MYKKPNKKMSEKQFTKKVKDTMGNEYMYDTLQYIVDRKKVPISRDI